jgi:hypothetical protein
MSTKRKPLDPAEVANKRILAERQARIDAEKDAQALESDLGLNIKPQQPEADNPAEFLRDEFDRKTFGEAFPTYTRIVYGPHPILTNFPDIKDRIEQMGLERFAQLTAETILLKGEKAVPNPVMQKTLRNAIAKFGAQAVANAFRERMMEIPVHEIEVEADRSDAMIFAQPMEEAVKMYGTPGMRPKFLSERCIGVLGMRGYQIVKNKQGDPVKVGTLLMGEIPVRVAEARQRHFAQESENAVAEAEEAFENASERAMRDAGGAPGVSVLRDRDNVTASASENESLVGRSRETGFKVERQR